MHLNIAEGWGRRTTRDRAKFYTEAWSSLQEVESALIEIGTDEEAPRALVEPCMRRVRNTTRLLSAFRRAVDDTRKAEDRTAEDGKAQDDGA